MKYKRRACLAAIILLLAPMILLSCSPRPRVEPVKGTVAKSAPLAAAKTATATTAPSATPVVDHPVDLVPEELTASPLPALPTANPADAARLTDTKDPEAAPSLAAEPAGCLSDQEVQAGSEQEDLARADRMLGLSRPLSRRILPENWNAYTQTFSAYAGNVLSLSVGDVQNQFMIQKIMNVLQVSGFITWLRSRPKQGLHILAISLRGKDWQSSPWAPYIRAYWQDAQHPSASLPSEDHAVVPVLKLPPCRWMVQAGYAAAIDAGWFSPQPAGRPDYARAAQPYLADTNAAAVQIARRINWLGDDGTEGPATMCGPLAWSIMQNAGAFPPDWGGWSVGPKAFWLSRPRTNGRPWSLFPSESYHLYQFREPLGKFDFTNFSLYPGDFLYTYSKGDGFDHMLVVTEVDGAGNVYTITNKIQMIPEKKITIERLLLLNLKDPAVGIARNQWANDRVNGRTGHAGFDVFRWAWMEKDILARPAAYLVQPGDTLALIAMRWKTPAEQIARYNGITVDASLSVGQELQIPSNETVGVR